MVTTVSPLNRMDYASRQQPQRHYFHDTFLILVQIAIVQSNIAITETYVTCFSYCIFQLSICAAGAIEYG